MQPANSTEGARFHADHAEVAHAAMARFCRAVDDADFDALASLLDNRVFYTPGPPNSVIEGRDDVLAYLRDRISQQPTARQHFVANTLVHTVEADTLYAECAHLVLRQHDGRLLLTSGTYHFAVRFSTGNKDRDIDGTDAPNDGATLITQLSVRQGIRFEAPAA